MRGRARLPGSRGAPRPRAPAAAAGCERIACNCSTARTEHDHPTTQRKPNLGVRSAPAPPRPHRKGKREPLLPGLAPFNSGLSGGAGATSRRRGVQPAAPSWAAPRRGHTEVKRHLNPRAAGGARLGQTKRRSDREAPRPVEALRGAATEWH